METLENDTRPILSVTEISLSLKACVEQVFSHVRVRGEVSGVKKAPSGHIYFCLKDKDSVLSAVAWRGRDKTTQNAITEGLEIICTGKLSTYPGRSNYQMIVDTAQPAGAGALLKLLNDRREKLQKEGLFDLSRKKKIPYLPEVIGVVTSPSGAVIRDIMHRLTDRFGRQVILWPVLVQGETAADQITAAINGFNAIPPEGIDVPYICKKSVPSSQAGISDTAILTDEQVTQTPVLQNNKGDLILNTSQEAVVLNHPVESSGLTDISLTLESGNASLLPPDTTHSKTTSTDKKMCIHLPRPDLLIVARGGGSLEDLWPFNEENVVRAAAASRIPLISAVGHETDTTLIDYAADLRAPTPTAAAELAVPVKLELAAKLSHAQTRLTEGVTRYLSEKQLKIENFSKSIPNLGDVINLFFQKLDDRSQRLQISIQNYLKIKENQFVNLKNLLKSYSFEAVLERGFSLVTGHNGKIIASARVAQTLPHMLISFYDGKVNVKPLDSSPAGCTPAAESTSLQTPEADISSSPCTKDSSHEHKKQSVNPACRGVPFDMSKTPPDTPSQEQQGTSHLKRHSNEKSASAKKKKKELNPNQRGLFDDL